jgi:hypothetical protein
MISITTLDGFDKLIEAETAADVEGLLHELAGPNVFISDEHWVPVGGLISNAGSIEASADEINPLIERVVNSIEATIELRYELADSGTRASITNLSDALSQLFDIPGGQTRRLLQPSSSLSNLVSMHLTGGTSDPTIAIVDEGIGVHPDDFDTTLLSLQQSSKGGKPYLIGMYGQGGSSTFDKSTYSVIVSRRHPDLLRGGQNDIGGFTVVRRSLAGRAHVYSYFVDPETGKVPTVSNEVLDQRNFVNGTRVASIEYRHLGPFADQVITNNAFYSMNYRLFDPPIPWRLVEHRSGMNPTYRTMRGVPYRLDQLGSESQGNSTVRHRSTFDYTNEEFGTLTVEIWILQDDRVAQERRQLSHRQSVNAYRDRARRYMRRRVAVTRGGQMHAALTQRMFDQRGLRHIGSSAIVQVNTDKLSDTAGASFFASNRADLKSESEQIIENAVVAAIESVSDELRAIERERQDEIVRGRGATDESAIRTRLDRLIDRFSRQQESGRAGGTRSGRSNSRFRGREVPTYLRWARDQVLEVRPGVPTRLDLVTDGADRALRPARVRKMVNSSSSLVRPQLVSGQDGRWRVDISVDPAAPIGLQADLDAIMTIEGVWTLSTTQHAQLRVVPPPPPYVGIHPPTVFRIRNSEGNVLIRPGRSSFTIETDASDDLFDHSTLDIVGPSDVNIVGYGSPRRGDIRVSVSVDEGLEPQNLGLVTATLNIDGSENLTDSANVRVVEKPSTGTASGPRQVPEYNIVDVRQMPQTETELTWDQMMETLGTEASWTAVDVAAVDIQNTDGEGASHKLVFFLNADNGPLEQAERRITATRMESGVEAARQYHRTLQCYHLYQLAVTAIRDDGTINLPDYDDYKLELVRLNDTLLYAQTEFSQAIESADD